MRLWHWLFRRRGERTGQQDADLVDAQERLIRLERAAADKERRLQRLNLDVQVKRRK